MMHVSSIPFDPPHLIYDLIQGEDLSEKRKESFETWSLIILPSEFSSWDLILFLY